MRFKQVSANQSVFNATDIPENSESKFVIKKLHYLCICMMLLKIVVTYPLECFVLHRIFPIFEAYCRIELLQLASNKGRPVVCGVLLLRRLVRCSVVATIIVIN